MGRVGRLEMPYSEFLLSGREGELSLETWLELELEFGFKGLDCEGWDLEVLVLLSKSILLRSSFV